MPAKSACAASAGGTHWPNSRKPRAVDSLDEAEVLEFNCGQYLRSHDRLGRVDRQIEFADAGIRGW